MEPQEKLRQLLSRALDERSLKKIILSRPRNPAVLRTEGRLIVLKGQTVLQLESFMADGKALHRNLPLSEAVDALTDALSTYRQLNLITTGGTAEAKISAKGKLLVSGKIGGGEAMAPSAHNREKQTILREGVRYDYLVALGVTDENGRVLDKKSAKFRQIDRFLHYIEEITPRLKGRELYILDLCCGKSYLTFAAYDYLTAAKGYTVTMVGADRKPDVIAYCADIARSLGYHGLTFECCDITTYEPARRPDLVLSLHACDIATDIVLTTAARLGAEVILSTPCCHHQLMDQLSTDSSLGRELSPLLAHSLLKQKLAVALTDALRCKRLEAAGYRVDVTELIDPENTPKNLMIRAILSPMSDGDKAKHEAEFRALEAIAGVRLFGS